MPEQTASRGARSLCPDEETIAAYIDGSLGPDERASVSAHAADCERCYELVSEVAHVREILEASGGPEVAQSQAVTGNVRRFPSRRKLMIAGGVLASAAALILIVRSERATDGDRQLAVLVNAVKAERTFDGRLTGGFVHAPLRSPSRSVSSTRPGNLDLLTAVARAQKAVEADDSPANRHAWGVAQLLVGEYDGAIESLAAASGARSQAARYASDLAVAHLARAAARARPDDRARALEAIDRALALEPTLAEAWFTRAVVLEQQNQRDAAVDAWTRYLSLDSDSAWAAEARRRLKALRVP